MQSTEQDLRPADSVPQSRRTRFSGRDCRDASPAPRRERARLLKLGRPLGRAICGLITIVHYDTFFRWKKRADGTPPAHRGHRGRPRTPRGDPPARAPGSPRARPVGDIPAYSGNSESSAFTRLAGPRSTTSSAITATIRRRIDRREHVGSLPQASSGETLWASDIVTKRIWTKTGLRFARVLIFINIASRRVWASPCTFHSNGEWCAETGGGVCR